MVVKSPNRSLIILIKVFIICYLVIYIFPFPFNYLSNGTEKILNGPLNYLTIFLEKILFNSHKLNIENNGSSDTSFLFFKQLLIVLISFLFSISTFYFWTLERVEQFYAVALFYARCFLSFNLMLYGLGKLPSGVEQFPFPSTDVLLTPIGDLSPMRLAWVFFGYSKTYLTFIGLTEFLVGALLLFRRTLMLGCVIGLGLVLNIVFINLGYDVPVKLFSLNLLLMLMVLSSQYFNVLYSFFISKKIVESTEYETISLFNKKVSVNSRSIFYIKGSIITIFILIFIFCIPKEPTYPTSKLDGLYQVEEFYLNKNTSTSTCLEEKKWKRIIVENGVFIIYREEGMLVYRIDNIDDRSIKISNYSNLKEQYTLGYKIEKGEYCHLSGNFDNDFVKISLLPTDRDSLPLLKRKFNWINEEPYNR